MKAALVAALLCWSAAARAWNVDGSDVAARISDLDAAWKGLSKGAILADKVKRADQSKAPDWVAKAGWKDAEVPASLKDRMKMQDASGWTVDVGDKVAAFTVGVAHGVRSKSLAVSSAEERARATIAKLTVPPQAAGIVSARVESQTLDWYFNADGDCFALAFGRAVPARKN